MERANPCGFLVICAILAAHLTLCSSSPIDSFGGGDHRQLGFFPMKSECRGSIAECLMSGGYEELDSEFAMDSESNRRILATRQYISYGALRRNSVPCSRRGASYYNCRPGAQANPYRRGCSTITRCRR
ncbi:protein RALF-like 33 [Juglans microcarpa x Juglans regia]|uniref:protein RALF-like 33 n=1 Tax=Juglans microcarpa x Juglans regia TaxID=2249226 RepID=UPI001B7F324E|nr:protein RALF-like 33 [Juglans microcarpa x Juglans regia]